MKNCVIALLILASCAYILPSPSSVDDLSMQLLQATDDVAVILVYNKIKPDYVVHQPFYVMFDPQITPNDNFEKSL